MPVSAGVWASRQRRWLRYHRYLYDMRPEQVEVTDEEWDAELREWERVCDEHGVKKDYHGVWAWDVERLWRGAISPRKPLPFGMEE